MKNYRFLFVLIVGWAMAMGAVATAETSAGTIGSTTITIDDPIHFLSVDGSDVLVGPGNYTVEAVESWLRLVPGARRDAVLIEGESLTHGEVLKGSSANVHVIDSDVRQVELLMSDGTGLQAIGTVSGVLPRKVLNANSRPQMRPAQTFANSHTANIVVPPIKNDRIKLFQPKDLNDKILMDLIQMLIDRSRALENKLEQQRKKVDELKKNAASHRHDYEVEYVVTGGKSFITINMLKNLIENFDAEHPSKGHLFEKGVMFGQKWEAEKHKKETSLPK